MRRQRSELEMLLTWTLSEEGDDRQLGFGIEVLSSG